MLLQVPVGDGSDDYLEVEAEAFGTAEVELAGGPESMAARIAAFSLTSAVRKVVPAIRAVVAEVRNDDLAPDEVTMEAGLKVGGEQGLVLTKGTAEANFKLTMTWRRPGTQ